MQKVLNVLKKFKWLLILLIVAGVVVLNLSGAH